jgi:proton-dependent oligopeptide transporter, POT family
MSSIAAARPAEKELLGHPIGLATLFGTEMFERFSYYGMRALLMPFMTASIAAGGLGYTTAKAGPIYGFYTFGVYGLSIFGGMVADLLLGLYRSVLVGGIIIALGHLAIFIPTVPSFFVGLALIVIGTSMLKPNVSSLVGTLYHKDDQRRDAGFSIFYMGINLGAFLAPLITPVLRTQISWRWGFGAAGIGMVLGLIQYVAGRNYVIGRQAPRTDAAAARKEKKAAPKEPLTRDEWRRIIVIGILFLFSCLFWAAFEQAGSTLNLFAVRYTDTHLFGLRLEPETLQSVQPLFVIIFAPIFAMIWMGLGRREPSSPSKFSLGLIFVGLGMLLLMPAARVVQQTVGIKVSIWWLIGVYFLHTVGELCLSPVGLSVVTKLAPPRIVGSMMGVWFSSIALGNLAAGFIAGEMDKLPLTTIFGTVAAVTIGAGILLLLVVRPIRKLMVGVH